MSIFKGAGVAIVTPFNEDETVNYEDFGKLIDFQLANETDAVIVCGTTGEASTLTDEEQIECVRFAVKKVAKRVPVIAGAGSNHTSHGAELTKECAAAGADAILSVTPYYNKATQKGLIKHYEIIAAASDLPIILYNVPGRTSTNILPETVYELSKIPNIAAIKEASGNISQVAQVAALCRESIDIYSGNDDQVIPILSLGGKGVISVASNIIPKQMHDMVHNFLNGNIKEAAKIQLDYLDLMNSMFTEVNPIPIKAALELMGLSNAYYRAPMCNMEPNGLNVVKKELEKSGLL